MKNLFERTITGIIYVALIVGSILISKYTFVLLFGFILTYTLFEFYRLCKKGGFQPQTILGIIIALYLFTSFFLFDMNMVSKTIFFGLVPLLMVSPVLEMYRKNEKAVLNVALTFFGIIYIAVPFAVLNFIVTPYVQFPKQYVPEALLSLFIILWANDSGAYLFGSWLGKTKMAERISPKKTWEGAIGGAITALLVSLALFHYLNFINPFHSIVLSLLTVISGTIGDLTESMVKRNFNVKDSGGIMPGHGGLFDRFDSMLFAAPVYFIYISLILNH